MESNITMPNVDIMANISDIVEHKLYPKTEQALRLCAIGTDPAEALKIVNGKDKIHRNAVTSLKKKYAKWSLKNPSVVKLANNQVKRILQGEGRGIEQQKVTAQGQVIDYTETVVPSDTNILAAAMMVYDRVEPIKGNDPGDTPGVQFIDLTTYNVQINNNS